MENLAGLGRRFFAYLVDWYIGALVTAFPVSAVSMKLFETVKNQILVWRGHTLGKRWMKIKIADSSGGEASAGQLIIRQLAGIIILEGSLVSASTIWHQLVTILTGVNVVTALMYAGMAVSLVSAVLTLAGRRRAIHDRISGTVVVSCK